MRTAKIFLEQSVLFDQLGMRLFDGTIESIGIESYSGNLVVNVIGNDERIPDDPGYPLCHIMAKSIQSHFEPMDIREAHGKAGEIA